LPLVIAKRVSFLHINTREVMGKGDKRTKKGKIINKSYGKSRPKKSKLARAKKA